MAMQRCRACGKQARKMTIALVLDGRGYKGGRVCGACTSAGVLVVAPRVAPVLDTAKAERIAQKEALAPFVKLFEGQAKALRMTESNGDRDDYIDGKIEGLETAIAVLKGGRA